MEKRAALKVTILANGEFPTKKERIKELYQTNFLIVCDGAITHLESRHIIPDIIIGDLDSISQDLKLKYSSKIIHIADQNTNDLTKAFFHGRSLGFEHFNILGATGKREDHTIANIFLLTHFIQYAKTVVLKSDFGTFNVFYPPCTLSSIKGQQVSIFSPDIEAKITSINLKYPLHQLCLSSLEKGTLNEAIDNSFTLTSTKESPIIIYQADKD